MVTRVKVQRISAEFRSRSSVSGFWSALRAFALHAIQRVIHFKVLQAMYVTAVEPTFADVPAGMTAGFLDGATLRRMASEAKYDLTPEFVDDALSKGDECYGIFDGGQPAAYGWYARSPTLMSDRLCVQVDPSYVYMYKGLTLDAYRGRRLHAIGKTRALAAYQARGYKGMVSYIESDNVDSLKSAYRMGSVLFGRVFIIRILGRYLTLRTPGCAAFGFDVAPLRRNGGVTHGAAARPERVPVSTP
ncbi:MAG TPA: hypothetical protein VJJ54_08210 [Gemmatimonadales bacterium]|nr:hypothetical protein [Gemmatimonadales bacterium]